ncbi:MAG: ComEC/Rec2 family competence protein [Methanothrix sp.]
MYRLWIWLILLISAAMSSALGGENLTAHFIDVGQGDCILMTLEEKSILIDGGSLKMGQMVESYLREQNVSRLDRVILTHPHDDHMGGLIKILEDLPVEEVIESGQTDSSLLYKMFKSLIDQKNISHRRVQRGQEIVLNDDLKIDVLSPPLPSSPDLDNSSPIVLKIPAETVAVQIISGNINQNSLVLRVEYGNVSFLLMGDADTVTEGSLAASGCCNLSSNILKVGHHGGSSASSAPFLRCVMPEISIIQVGKDNFYGYPTQETLNALQEVGSEIYRTDRSGNIVITTDGLNYSVSTEKNS